MHDVSPLEIYEAGELTVIGFGNHEGIDRVNLAQWRDELLQLIRDHRCTTLALDLTQVQLIPSGLLGVLCSLKRQGVDVLLYNPSIDVREVVEISNLGSLLEMHEVELNGQ
jgi:anti-anti-sigma factor